MLRPLSILSLLVLSLAASVVAQVASPPTPNSSTDHSQEAFVIEQFSRQEKFENDGTSLREDTAKVRIQSEAGVQQYGLLSFSYASATGTFEIVYVRVRKPDGLVVETPPENVQDMAAEITRAAPFYSDLHEKHVAVKGLSVGDVLEYQIREHTTKPLAPGQFWTSYGFTRDQIVLDEQLEISIPRERTVKIKSITIQPAISEAGGYRIYTWHNRNLRHKDEINAKREATEQVWQQAQGRLPQPDVLMSSFASWEDVGRWYGELQKERGKTNAGDNRKGDGSDQRCLERRSKNAGAVWLCEYAISLYRGRIWDWAIPATQRVRSAGEPVWRLQGQTHPACFVARRGRNSGVPGVDQHDPGGK